MLHTARTRGTNDGENERVPFLRALETLLYFGRL